MKAFTEPLAELSEYEKIRKLLYKKSGIVGLTGCVDSQKMNIVYGLSDGFAYKIIVTFSDLKARELYEDYKFYDKETFIFPAKDLIFYQADIHGNKLTTERIKCFRKILEGKPLTIITTFNSFMTPQLPLSKLQSSIVSVCINKELNSKKFLKKLVELGYEHTTQVEIPGQFSLRGGIIDIFDLTEENPYRVELWGDDVDSIRSFDVLSQRSIENLDSIVIYPATETILTDGEIHDGLLAIETEGKHVETKFRDSFKTEEAHRIATGIKELKEQITEFKSYCNLESYIKYFYKNTETFLDFFADEQTAVFLDEPARIAEHASAVELEFRESMIHRIEKGYMLPGQTDFLYSYEQVMAKIVKKHTAAVSMIDLRAPLLKTENKFHLSAKSVGSYNNSFETLVKDLTRYKKNGYRVILLSPSRTRAKRLAEDLLQYGLTSFYSENPDREVLQGEVMTFYGHMKKGFEYPLLKYVVMTESDIFGTQKKKRTKRKTYEGQKINDFTELKVGDYVVHESHGLGIYKGIEKVEIDKVAKDYMKIEYRGGGNLYILATGLDVIQKYASADAKTPKLNKLGTQEWSRTKTKVKGAVADIAKDLVQLYALRQEKRGYHYNQDTVWQKEFEELFPYEETEDQLLAIEAAKGDMESDKIMDRLICGDVGYGKTEIAIRAAFKAVQDGKQVVYLVPTTILAQQHYTTFVQRMKDFPVRVELMSRFRTPSQQKKTIEDLKKGFVDIVIGTHRLLSTDMQYKDLGLLIVDEEQRFGVAHKEKIKKMRDDVDVLTLTATPIPRTLHMSLVGIRDMSVLEEAPNERMPIQTYVLEYNEEMIREAIYRELARNGQVYYVYNRVHNIADITARLQELAPDASIAFAHGQMKERELEKIMYDFISGDIDVLVSTTIIETGLDISNVNTMIIHDSDNMGLSQLYQLRGRVGRSNRSSYAFLMYKRDKMLKEVAEKRLQAIREFTDLGSGFKIAMRDLEIRGAGNLLGAAQHGHMEAVGYDLYCKMLNEAVKKLKGVNKVTEDFHTTVEINVDAFIPAIYIVNEFQKLDIYKRIASIENQAECNDMKEELLDRFGTIPKSVENLLAISLIRAQAHELYVTEVKAKVEWIQIEMKDDAPVNAALIPSLLKKHENKLTFSVKGNPTFIYKYKKCGFLEKDGVILLEHVKMLLKDMQMLIETT